MELGDRIRKVRRDVHMTQAELAVAVGVSTRSIQAYEMNRSVPRSYDMYLKLANALRVTPEYLSDMKEKDVEAADFVQAATTKYGPRGKAQAKAILEQASALFAGGELTEEDEIVFMHEMQEIYFQAKVAAKKYTPKRYVKPKDE